MREPTGRLKEKVRKENLWLFILRLLKEGKRYGSEIREAVNEKFGFWIGNVTAYKVLYLLENDGYVEKEKQGRKKYYKITEKGEEELEEAKKFFRETLSKLSK
ncbi:MAG: PadR family transcriptional regulator [Candidatus Aenigmatarchaeota archaeon]